MNALITRHDYVEFIDSWNLKAEYEIVENTPDVLIIVYCHPFKVFTTRKVKAMFNALKGLVCVGANARLIFSYEKM